jgi:hypothetical protein
MIKDTPELLFLSLFYRSTKKKDCVSTTKAIKNTPAYGKYKIRSHVADASRHSARYSDYCDTYKPCTFLLVIKDVYETSTASRK